MLALRLRTNGDAVEQIQPDLIIPTGRRKGANPSLSSIYRALAEYEKTPDDLRVSCARDSSVEAGE